MAGFTLKFSVPDWCFLNTDADAAGYYRFLASHGITAVEMVDPSRWTIARDAGLEIINHSGPGMQKGFSEPANHDRLIAEIVPLAAELERAGIPDLIVFSGNRNGLEDAAGFDNCVRGLSRLLDELKGCRTRLIFEMLNSFDHRDYLADNEKFGFALAEVLDTPRFSLLYDVYHMCRAGARPLEHFDQKQKRITHFHVAALEKRGFPGEGMHIDYRKFIRELSRTTYRGRVGFEFCGGSPERAAEAAQLFSTFL